MTSKNVLLLFHEIVLAGSTVVFYTVLGHTLSTGFSDSSIYFSHFIFIILQFYISSV